MSASTRDTKARRTETTHFSSQFLRVKALLTSEFCLLTFVFFSGILHPASRRYFAGIRKRVPVRIFRGSVMLLAFIKASAEMPCRLAIADGVSPGFTT